MQNYFFLKSVNCNIFFILLKSTNTIIYKEKYITQLCKLLLLLPSIFASNYYYKITVIHITCKPYR